MLLYLEGMIQNRLSKEPMGRPAVPYFAYSELSDGILNTLRQLGFAFLLTILAAGCASTSTTSGKKLMSQVCRARLPGRSDLKNPYSAFLSLNDVGVGIYDTPGTRLLIQRLSDPVAKFLGVPDITKNIHVVFDDAYGALSTPDGHVYITTGALLQAKSDQEVIGLLGHEIGHLRCGHPSSASRIQLAKWGQLAGMLLASGGAGSPLGMAVSVEAGSNSQKYAVTGGSRAFEFQADLMAADALMATTGKYTGALAFLDQIDDTRDETPDVSLLSGADHPHVDDRKDNIRQYVQSHYPNADIPVPLSSINIEEWRRSESALLESFADAERAAMELTLPFALFYSQKVPPPPSVTQPIEALLHSATARLKQLPQGGDTSLEILQKTWFFRFAELELSARIKYRPGIDISDETAAFKEVIYSSEVPEWFIYWSALLAAKIHWYVTADSLLDSAENRYADATLTYPLHLAVLNMAQREDGQLIAGKSLSIVLKCGFLLSDLTSLCKVASNNPSAFIDRGWADYTVAASKLKNAGLKK